MKSSPAQSHTRQGFTLTELLVTMAIVGILAGLSVAAFNRNWKDERVKAAVQTTNGWLEEMRRRAIQQSATCRIQVDPATASFNRAPDTWGGNCGSFASLNLRQQVQSGSDLLLCVQPLNITDPTSGASTCTTSQTGSAQSGSNQIVFTPRGTSNTSLLLKFHFAGAVSDRCLAVVAPLGLIRPGKASSSGGACDFNASY